MSLHFSKKPLNTSAQIDFLISKGLLVSDQGHAESILDAVSYYRLSAYLKPFKKDELFIRNASFDHVWQLYQFDRELRLLVLDAIEKIEVAFRTTITNKTSTELGAFWYVDKKFYGNDSLFEQIKSEVDRITEQKHELFIQHYYQKYSQPLYPPIWMIAEALSFGRIVKMFRGIQSSDLKKAIGSAFRQPEKRISSWMQALAYIRNICAHHSRLWNRWFVYTPTISKKEKLRDILLPQKHKFITVIYAIDKMLKNIAPKSNWKERVFNLMDKYDKHHFSYQAMGFPKNWQKSPIWDD